MRVASALRQKISAYLELQSVKRHGSRLGRRWAPAYTKYLDRCRAKFIGDVDAPVEIERAARDFQKKGFATLWNERTAELAETIFAKIQQEEKAGLNVWDADQRYHAEVYTKFPEIERLFRGPLGSFLRAVYKTHFKIFFGVLYKSERIQNGPSGSQLWHTDGGPGTCINVMFYLKDVSREDGAMECLPWDASLEIYRKELLSAEVHRRSRAVSAHTSERDVKCSFYLNEISESYRDRVEQPAGRAGLLLSFRNNILHKGGFPEPNRTRYVCVFHCYPSDRPTPFDRYATAGLPKKGSYPKDPAADF